MSDFSNDDSKKITTTSNKKKAPKRKTKDIVDDGPIVDDVVDDAAKVHVPVPLVRLMTTGMLYHSSQSSSPSSKPTAAPIARSTSTSSKSTKKSDSAAASSSSAAAASSASSSSSSSDADAASAAAANIVEPVSAPIVDEPMPMTGPSEDGEIKEGEGEIEPKAKKPRTIKPKPRHVLVLIDDVVMPTSTDPATLLLNNDDSVDAHYRFNQVLVSKLQMSHEDFVKHVAKRQQNRNRFLKAARANAPVDVAATIASYNEFLTAAPIEMFVGLTSNPTVSWAVSDSVAGQTLTDTPVSFPGRDGDVQSNAVHALIGECVKRGLHGPLGFVKIGTTDSVYVGPNLNLGKKVTGHPLACTQKFNKRTERTTEDILGLNTNMLLD